LKAARITPSQNFHRYVSITTRLQIFGKNRIRDLLELNRPDLRKAPIEEGKRTLAKLLRRSPAGITFNEHYEGDGTTLFQHARFGCEGIVSKRLGSPYRSGRVDDWLKIKNPLAPAVKREAEWSR
jgi:ATP-dependent DNA ligase